ncbi:ubiquinone anaerobic biosynthesis accessory factor UbiT [Aliikangiella sp. IMCC44359]|uniref:ubiquinone anaerobic biosynthesis accessory factor UbiT n=1 Tax=Aliikangiella sp. IMCC44359 TaxID=3459125 RepID=UPI00403A8B1B
MSLPIVVHQLIKTKASFISRHLTPDKLAKISTLLPFSFNKKLIEITLNTILKEQIIDNCFDFLTNKIVLINIKDADLNIGLSFSHKKLVCLYFSQLKQIADAELSINTPDAICLMLQEKDPDTLFFQRKLSINGDTELAHQLKNTIDAFDPETMPKLLKLLLGKQVNT